MNAITQIEAVPHETAVVVVGAGPVGLALAVELSGRGVPCVVVDPDPRTRIVPRAKLANVRTMEHLRRWGIADELRNASPLPASFSTDISFVTTLFGEEITRFTDVFHTEHRRDSRFAEPAQQVPQYVVEPVLRRHAVAQGANVVVGWRADAFEELPSGVRVGLVGEDGVTTQIDAEYIVGCDGASSMVRGALGISLHGQPAMARNYGVVFRSDELSRNLPHKPALHFWTVNSEVPAYMGPADQEGLWWLQATALPSTVDTDALDPLAIVHGAVGRRVAASIVNVDPWDAHALTAERVREGRIFLAGDAAHVHTPMGAHGMNLGIGDAVDLGWKLAAVIEGWAPSSLLDSYGAERQALHERVTEEATRNYGALPKHFVREGLGGDDEHARATRAAAAGEIQRRKHREFFSLGLVLGRGASDSPIVVPDAAPPVQEHVERFVSVARAGVRAPHAWLPGGSSLFDHFGRGYTLLQLDVSLDVSPVVRAAGTRGIPLKVLSLPDRELRKLYGAKAALVRPDQVVAWRGSALDPSDADRLLDVVTGRTPQVA